MQARFESIVARTSSMAKTNKRSSITLKDMLQASTMLEELKVKRAKYLLEIGEDEVDRIVRRYIARTKAMHTPDADYTVELNYPNGRKLKICKVYHEHIPYIRPDELEEKAIICKDLYFSDGMY